MDTHLDSNRTRVVASGPRPTVTLLLTVTGLLAADGCIEPHCPKGYDERGDICYRIRDAGGDGGDTADGGGASHVDVGDAGAEDAAAESDGCGDACGAHASCDAEQQKCTCDPGYIEEAGECIQCNSAAECADKTCQTKRCASGRCVYAEVSAGQRGSCSGNLVCTAAHECRECASDTQCDHLDGVCSEGVCDPSSGTCQAKPKSSSCGNLKICSGMSCADSCGNGVVDTVAGEECDPKAAAAGWDDWSCNRETCRRTGLLSSTSYHQCAGDADCTENETCKPTFVQPIIPVCIPKCFWGSCPFPPGYKSAIPTDRQSLSCDDARGYECWIDCATDDDCPPGVTCVGGGLCAAYD